MVTIGFWSHTWIEHLLKYFVYVGTDKSWTWPPLHFHKIVKMSTKSYSLFFIDKSGVDFKRIWNKFLEALSMRRLQSKTCYTIIFLAFFLFHWRNCVCYQILKMWAWTINLLLFFFLTENYLPERLPNGWATLFLAYILFFR